MRIASLSLAFLVLCAAHAAAQGNQISVKYRAWQTTLDGDAETDENGIAGTELSLDRHLDIEEDVVVHDVTIWGNIPTLGPVRFNYWEGTYEGENLSSGFTWGGEVFPAATPLDTTYEITSIALMWQYPLAAEQIGSAGSIEAALEVGYQYYFIEGEVHSSSMHGASRISSTLITSGLRSFMQLASWLYTEIQFTAGVYSLKDDVDNTYWEAVVDLQINPLEELFVGFGYRRVEIEIDDERHGSDSETKLDGRIDGFFISLSYHF